MRRTSIAAFACVLGLSAPASADPICEWMEFAGKIEKAAAPPPEAPRTGEHDRALTHAALAMFEALNAIDRRFEPYLGLAKADPKASQEAASATAAYEVLLAHFPSQKAALEESYAMTLDTVADARARELGVSVGKAAAALALKGGIVDPSVVQTPYLPRTAVGIWVPTQLPVFPPYYTAQKPWLIARADAVRPGPPPAISSERYARDYAEVKKVGGKTSADRSAHETLMARYRITPDMMPALRMIADASGRRMVENARLFALYHMVSDDASLAMADAKLHYDYWRPITAIRNGENDGNPATVGDPSWESLITTPNHPEYPCGHCIVAGSTAELMKLEYGNSPPGGVRVASRSIPNSAVQVHASWDKWAEEVSYSRTLGGVHYRFSNEAGEEMGRKVARIGLSKAMRPLQK
jgi:hypothetical protein